MMPFWLHRVIRFVTGAGSEAKKVSPGGTADDISRAKELIERNGLQRLYVDER